MPPVVSSGPNRRGEDRNKMRCYGVIDKGLVRKTNQDNYIIAGNEVGDVFAVVCDGIGGGNGGDVASKMAIDYFSEVFSNHRGFKDLEDATTWIRYHVAQANERIYIRASQVKDYKGMGTTLVACLVSKVGTLVVNVGDSRCYGVINDTLTQITRDHNLVNDLLDRGEITPEEAKTHPKRHVLTNALGVWSTCRIDIYQVSQPLKGYLLCSDGLYGYVSHTEIEKVITGSSMTSGYKARKLLNLALKAGGYDIIWLI